VLSYYYQLAQVNVARMRGPIDSPVMAEFVAQLPAVNALADHSPGFVWRLQTEDGNATSLRSFEDDRMMINMSVWESIDVLSDFVYRSGHVDVMRRRREWFERMEMHMALWWVPVGHIPSIDEALERIDHLREHGPTPYAFTFKARFLVDEKLVIYEEIGCLA